MEMTAVAPVPEDKDGSAPPRDPARERIVRTAYDLFCRHGLQAVGIDRIIAEAGVAKATLYRYFRSKDDLVLACLERRQDLWTWGWLAGEVQRRGRTPRARLLAIFDAFDEWFRRPDYEGDLIISSLLESHDRTTPVGAASVMGIAAVRSFVGRLTEEAGVRNPAGLAHQWKILMIGSMVLALAGDVEAALRAREVAAQLLEGEAGLSSRDGC
jgi:AcrR family transcriptional regulator